jgi:hypothetical protein
MGQETHSAKKSPLPVLKLPEIQLQLHRFMQITQNKLIPTSLFTGHIIDALH